MTLGTPPPDEFLDEARDKAKTVLNLLRAANLQASFALDQDEAEQLWGAKLVRYDLDALLEAADEWLMTPGLEFPTLAEFDVVASAKHRALSAAAYQASLPMDDVRACDECWATLMVDTGSGIRPCSVCNAPAYHLWVHRGYNSTSDRAPGKEARKKLTREAQDKGTRATLAADPTDPRWLSALTCPDCKGGTCQPPGWTRTGGSSVQAPDNNPWCRTCRPDEWAVVDEGHREPQHPYRTCEHPSCRTRAEVEDLMDRRVA